MKINTGIDGEARLDLANELSRLLADTYTLYIKTHNFHWNVTGPLFSTLHQMFEKQYTDLAGAVDLIAERIRALGVFAPGSYAEFSRLSSIEEAVEVPRAKEMIRALVKGNETLIATARRVARHAEHASDQATLDLVTQRLRIHEKTAWMLRSLLEE